jgi:hypothetical protein
MTLGPKMKKALVISAKHAVNAVLTDTALSQFFPLIFNFHSAAGLVAFAKGAGAAVLAREIAVWLPPLLKWSQENLSWSGNVNQ